MDNLPEEFIETPINTNRYEDLGDMEEYPIRIPTHKVFNNDTGEIDDMPATMDEIDFNYAKETQKNKKQKNTFWGKVKVVGDTIEDVLNDFNVGAVRTGTQLLDSSIYFLYNVDDLRRELFEAEQRGDDRESILKKWRLNEIERLRKNIKQGSEKIQNILRPIDERTDTDDFLINLAQGGITTGMSIATAIATGNPTLSAALMATLFGYMRNIELEDVALEKGLDYETADAYATFGGSIEGFLELAFDKVLFGTIQATPFRKSLQRAVANNDVLITSGKKIAFKQSLAKSVGKGAAIEFGQEASQGIVGQTYETALGEDFNWSEIAEQAIIGAVTGGVGGLVSTSGYNTLVERYDAIIKNQVNEIMPEASSQEKQKVTNALHEVLMQTGDTFLEELTKLSQKQLEPDTLPEKTDIGVSKEVKRIMKERFKLSDEQVDKIAKRANAAYNLRKDFNNATIHFFNQLKEGGVADAVAVSQARILAARASAISLDTGVGLQEVVEKMGINIKRAELSEISPDSLYQFIGEKAIGIDKTALEEAKRMDKLGASPEHTRQTTGWFKGGDGKWRFEISDKDMKINEEEIKKEQVTTLDKIITYDEIFKYYPELKNIKVDIYDFGKGTELNPAGVDVLKKELYINTRGKGYLRNSVAHEIQHLIQLIEGFYTGDSILYFNQYEEESRKAFSAMVDRLVRDELRKRNLNDDDWTVSATREAVISSKEYFEDMAKKLSLYFGINTNDARDLRKEIYSNKEFKDFLRKHPEYSDKYEYYIHSGGEIEAFVTGQSVDLSMQERLGSSLQEREAKAVAHLGVLDRNKIRYEQKKKGVTKGFYTPSTRTISLTEYSDPSTIIHETGHFFKDDLQSMKGNPKADKQLEALNKYVGATEGQPWTTEQEEVFARAFEKYLLDGKAPNNVLKDAFKDFSGWLRMIYGEGQRLGMVTPELKKALNDMLGGKRLDNALQFGEIILQEKLRKGELTRKEIGKSIHRLLNWTKPRKENGKLVGRFPDKAVNDFFDKTRKTLATKKDDAIIKITQNLIDIQAGMDEGLDVSDLIWENKLLSVASNKADLSLTAEVYNALSETYNEGKVGERVKREARKLHRNTIIKNAKEVLFQGKGKDWRTESSRTKQAIRRAGIFYQGWNGILDTLSMFDKSSKVGYSQLNRDLSVYQEETAMNTGIREDSEKLGELLSKALGTGKSTSRYINSTAKEKIKIEWGDNSKTFTREQLIDIYMKSKDPETKAIMEKDDVLQYNNEFLARVDEVLTDEDIKVADALFEFYRQNYEKVNKFYEDKYGISLGKNENYSPRSMQSQNIDVRNGDLRSGASVSSFKQRTAKGGQVQVKGAFRVFSDYITSTNHYIAFSDKLQDLNAVFSEAEIRNMIDNTFGKPMNRAIRYEIDRFATNNQKFLEIYDGVLSKIRSNYVVATLGAKPSIAIKQLVSFPAYLEKMSLSDFVAGVTEFAINPKKAMEILNESEYMKNRGFSVTQDFQKISKSETFKKFATQRGFRDFLMMNVELGDKGAIYIGGYALYRTEYNKNISRGMDEKSAKLKALDTVSRYTNATQQSSYMSEQSALQSNGFTNMLTLFQTAQNQYLRKEIGAIRGLATGRMSTKDAIKVLGIYHFLLPMLFQYVSDFGRWNWDNQKRAAILGSFNGAYVLSKVLESVVDWAVTGKFRQNYTRLLDVVPVWTVIEEYQKMVEALSELDPDDITLDDVGDVLVQSSKAAGYGFGVPMKYITDVGTKLPEYIEKGEYLKAIGLTLGWTPWALEQ